MQINGIDYTSWLTSTSRATTTSILQQQEIRTRQAELSQTQTGVAELIGKLTVAEDLIKTTTVRRQRNAEVISQVDLGLDTAPLSSAVLKSTAEVNATPTSFSTFGPAWSGASTALVTLDGVYDGAQGDDNLTFTVRKAGDQGSDILKIEINRADGSKLEDINIARSDPIDAAYTLSNGIVFTLGSGSLSKNDSFTLDVSTSIGSAVDPSKPFAGVRNQNPNLEYGMNVGNGSFEVNGVVITVSTTDSLNDVLDRITASGANVSATFDAASEQVVLTQKTPGSDHSIVVGNDSSGFLAATKLAAATVTPGNNGNATSPLSQLASFSGVQSGTFQVNGTDIAIDVASDSLNDVLDRISASAAAVSAFAVDNRYMLIQATDPEAELRLQDNDTGFFAALRIREDVYQPLEKGRIAKHRARKITEAVEDVAVAFNQLFGAPGAADNNSLQKIRSQVEGAISHTLNALEDQNKPDLGLGFQFTPTQSELLFEDKQRQTFERNLSKYFIDFRELLTGESKSRRGGLFGQLIEMLDQSLSSMGSELGRLGLLVDTFA